MHVNSLKFAWSKPKKQRSQKDRNSNELNQRKQADTNMKRASSQPMGN